MRKPRTGRLKIREGGRKPTLIGIIKWISGASAGVFLIFLFIAVIVQIVSRAFGVLVPSADDVARYAMAISALHGLAYTYLEVAHVRVTLVIGNLRGRVARGFALIIACVTMVVVGLLTYYWVEMAYESFVFNSRSAGLLAFPLWIIQFIALFGLVLFLISVLVDTMATLLRGESHVASTGGAHGRTR